MNSSLPDPTWHTKPESPWFFISMMGLILLQGVGMVTLAVLKALSII